MVRFTRIYSLVAVCFGLVAAFFIVLPAGAVLQQTDQSSSFASSNGTFGGFVWNNNSTGGDPDATSDQVNSITVSIKNTSGSSNCHAHMVLDNGIGGTESSTNTIKLTSSFQPFTFRFTPSANYRENDLKDFYINSGNGTSATSTNPCTLASNYTLNYVSSASDVYSYGTGMLKLSPLATTTKDTYFAVNGGHSTIQFTLTPTSTCAFYNFGVSAYVAPADETACGANIFTGNNISGESGNCTVGVAYKLYDGTYATYPFNSNGGRGAFNQAVNGILRAIPSPGTFSSGTVYSARAYMCSASSTYDCYLGVGSNSNIFAYSNNWDFIINGLNSCTSTYYSQGLLNYDTSTNIFNANNYATLLSLQAHVYCGTSAGSGTFAPVIAGFCNALVSLFIPSQDALNNFSQLKGRLQNKPPFGYLSTYGAALESITSATSTSSSIATTSLAAYISTFTSGTAWYQNILTVLRALLWIGAAVAWYHYFKHFSIRG